MLVLFSYVTVRSAVLGEERRKRKRKEFESRWVEELPGILPGNTMERVNTSLGCPPNNISSGINQITVVLSS